MSTYLKSEVVVVTMTVIEYSVSVALIIMLFVILCSFKKENQTKVSLKRLFIAVTVILFSVGTVIKIITEPEEFIAVINAFGVLLSATTFLFSFPKKGLDTENDTWEDS